MELHGKLDKSQKKPQIISLKFQINKQYNMQSNIYHTNFFYNKKVNEQIARWLVG
jgi:hypothetical protein